MRTTALAAVAVLFGVAVSSSGCSAFVSCVNTPAMRVDSPDRSLSVEVFERDCGATTDFSTQISIVKPGKVETGGGNLFVADANHGAVTAEGPHHVLPMMSVRWLPDGGLRISYPKAARVFLRKTVRDGVRVAYVET